jgi:hypothetical protein
MANTLKFGNGQWATKDGSCLSLQFTKTETSNLYLLTLQGHQVLQGLTKMV